MAKETHARLDALTGQLQRALGDNLVALVLFGSGARGDWVARRSDLNTLLIVRDASVTALRPAAAALAAWSAKEPPSLIFSENEWRTSTDVFPLEIEDMRDAHRLLAGKDPFAGITIDRTDLRRQVERELRGKLLQLRTQYAAAAEDGKTLSRLLENSAGTFFVLFRSVLRLAGRKPPEDASGLVREVASVAGFEAGGFDWARRRRDGERVPDLGRLDPLAEKYVAAVERLAKFVDEM